MEKTECDNCKLITLMAGLLKDKNETIRRLTEDKRNPLSITQIAMGFNPN